MKNNCNLLHSRIVRSIGVQFDLSHASKVMSAPILAQMPIYLYAKIAYDATLLLMTILIFFPSISPLHKWGIAIL